MSFRRARRRRGGYWHDPESIEGQAERDAQLGRTAFYVYVLTSDHGHYVGHTWNVRSRVRQHQRGEVPSTVGGRPSLLWQSSALASREEAARFEAALKSWRDQRSERLRQTVGVSPEPFRRRREHRPASRRGLPIGCALVAGLLLMALLFIAAFGRAG